MTDYYDQAAQLRDELIADGKIISPMVEKAFRMVPRELFVPTDTPLKGDLQRRSLGGDQDRCSAITFRLLEVHPMSVTLSDRTPRAVMFPSSDHFPLGQAYGRVEATPAPASDMRPFGLTLAVPTKTSVRINPAELGYDDIRQIGLIRDGEHMVPLSKHTDGPTNTQTNSDGQKGYDSDTDHRED
ncbi:MAG: putative ATP-grasp-modified RiPP [Acidimicrobiia bacterium]